MRKRLSAGALAALAAAVVFSGSDAGAGTRLRFHYAPFYGAYEPGPEWLPPPRYYYYYDEPDRFYEYDESYYEPEYLGPDDEPAPVKPRKKLKPAALPEPGTAKKKATVANAATAESKPQAATGLSCDKATAIVSGYGFAAVKAEDCDGKVYAFNATRDGKAYAIKLSAASGELTEVKKLQ